MAYYDGDSAWSAGATPPARQASWERQAPSRMAAMSPPAQSPFSADAHAFAAQFEEIDRATDNLMKSGKWFPGQAAVAAGAGGMGGMRRDSGMLGSSPARAAAMGRGGFEYGGGANAGSGSDARGSPMGMPAPLPQAMSGGRQHQHQHPSMGEFMDNRPGASSATGFYSNQRFGGPSASGSSGVGGRGQQSEAEQMLQAKRRMAAQRERELRNYHQEQQYHRISGGKSERSMSPNTQQQTDENHRELITRQHRALYGESSSLYGSGPDSSGAPVDGTSRASSQDVRVHSGGRGPSPLSYDPYGVVVQQQNNSGTDASATRDSMDGGSGSSITGLTSPSSVQQATFSPRGSDSQQQTSRTSTSSPSAGTSPPLVQGQQGAKGISGVAPIGTRPSGAAAGAAATSNKRSTTPLTPSALSHGISADGSKLDLERTTSAATGGSGPNANAPLSAAAEKGVPGLGSAWGSNAGGVWGAAGGKGGPLAVQPSVWG